MVPSILGNKCSIESVGKHLADESVDLIYLDPPFNSNRSYNVLFKSKSGDEAQAQLEAFDDTWVWSHQTATPATSCARSDPSPPPSSATGS